MLHKISRTLIFLMALAVGATAQAATVYNDYLVNSNGLAYSTAPILNTNTSGLTKLAFQAVCSSATIAAQTFTNGFASTGSITVATNSGFTAVGATNTITLGSTSALAARAASNRITITSNTAVSGSILTINGTQLYEGRDWTRTATATGTAVALAAIITNFPGIDANATSTVVYATATTAGRSGNSFTIVSSTQAALTVASANFTGGSDQALTSSVLTVNGYAYPANYLWTIMDTSSGTATSIASFLSKIDGIRASAVGLVVYATAPVGSNGNNFTITSSTPTAMTVASANFTNGRATATITINGQVFRNGAEWATGGSLALTAKAISDAIMANANINQLITSTWTAGGVVRTTATFVGTGGNYTISSNSSNLTVGGMTSGASTPIDLPTDTISFTSQNFTTALPVLLTLNTGTIPTGLTNNATYYPIIYSPTQIQLATTSALALAGTPVNITAQTSTGGGSYTLTPLGITGIASYKWQQSNDASNWFDMNVTSVTFATPYTSTTTFWDMGAVNAGYVRLNITGPTQGGIVLRVKGNGKTN